MLQGRLFAYGDAHRYRLGVNHTQLPVNAPHAAPVANYGRDGAMRFNDNSKRAKNYEPNSFDGPVESDEPLYAGLDGSGVSGTYPWDDREADDFSQAGVMYRMIPEDSKRRLVDAIADGLAQVSKNDIIERSIAHFRAADPDYGARVEQAVKARRG
jgi:catalase